MSIHATARRPIRPSAQLLLCICTNSKRQSKQRPEQTRKTALFRCVPELTADQGCGTWRELGALPGRQSPPPTPHAPPGPAHRPRAPRPAPPTGGVGQATLEATLHPRVYASCFLAGCLILLSPFMEGAGPPSPGDDLELSVIQGQPDEQTPLSGAVQGIFPLEEEPCPVQVRPSSLWQRYPTGSEPGCWPGPGPGTAVSGFQLAFWAQQTPSAGGARWNILNGADTTMPSTLSLPEAPRIPPAPRNLRNLIPEVCGSSLQRENPQR